MKYLEWNRAIGNYFFNSKKAGKEVLLYITQQEIIRLGLKVGTFSSSEESWSDYCNAVKNGFPEIGAKNGLIEKINIVTNKWLLYERWTFELKKSGLKLDNICIESEDGVVFPFYLGYLVLLIVPLTQNIDGYRSNSYYPKLNDFLKQNDIAPADVKALNFKYDIWANLEKWSKQYYQTDLGIFEKRNFGSSKWIHVGKPFSQCILTPKHLKNIPNLFWAASLSPDLAITSKEILSLLKYHGNKELGLSKKIISDVQDGNDDLSRVVVDIIKREYEKWEGDVYEYENGSEIIKSGWISAAMFSSFTIDQVNGEWEHQYYIYSRNDYPEDLIFAGNSIIPFVNGYSKPLNLPFNPLLSVEDKANRWKAFPNASEMILYRNGNYAGLSNDVWIETTEVTRTSQMYLLCKQSKEASIDTWGNHFEKANFKKETQLEGITEGYILYKFRNPTEEHPSEPLLKFRSVKTLELHGGLKTGNREYMHNALPAVRLTGCIGTERVFIEYIEDGSIAFLHQNPRYPEEYFLPEDIRLNNDFLIKVEGEALGGYTVPYKIIEPEINPFLINEQEIARRNKYGEQINNNEEAYIIGSNTVYNGWPKQLACSLDFLPVQHYVSSTYNACEVIPESALGDTILEYLTCLGDTSYDVFSAAFDWIISKADVMYPNDNLRWIKQLSIKFLDFLGHLDYEYSTRKININKPQLVLIPSKHNVEAILIGARTKNSLQRLINTARGLLINIEVRPQESKLDKYLLPVTIHLQPAECSTSLEAVDKLCKLAASIDIQFKQIERPEIKPAIIQFGLQDFSASITDYKQYMLSNNITDGNDHAWARSTFNMDTLRFEKFDGPLDTSLSFVRYSLKYQKFYQFWIGGTCYNVDENWGAYLMASEQGRNVIFYSGEDRKLAVPRNMQLPRLISESLMLLSGIAPSFKSFEVNRQKIVFQLYHNIPKLFAENLFRKFNQEVKPINL